MKPVMTMRSQRNVWSPQDTEALPRPLSTWARTLDARTHGHKCLTVAFPRYHRPGTPSDWQENRTLHKFGPSAWPHRKRAFPPEAVHAVEKRGPPQGKVSCTPGSIQAEAGPEKTDLFLALF